MKYLKNYEKFSDEYILNENLIKKTWTKIATYFMKKYKEIAWVYYMLFMKKTGQLKKWGVELILPYDVDSVSVKEVENNIDEKIDESLNFQVATINEGFVSLRSDDPNMVENDPIELMDSIRSVIEENIDRVENGDERADNSSTLFIWGAPGIGKTSIVKQIAKEMDMAVEVLLLSTKTPEDFKGVPAIRNLKGSAEVNDERTVFIPPKFLPWDNCPNGKGGILFFDEMNQANKDVLGASMSFCLDGTIEEYSLPEYWIIIAAGNREQDVGDGGNIIEFSNPLSNRFDHINYYQTKDSFISHAITKKDMNPDVIQFLEFKPDALFLMEEEQKSSLFPTPRAWVSASHSDYIKRKRNWENKLSDKEILNIYGKAIGLVTAGQFVQFMKLRAVFNENDVKDVYKLGEKCTKQLPSRADLSRAAAVAIGLHKKDIGVTEKDIKNVYGYALAAKDFEVATSIINYFNWVNPQIKTDPKLKSVTWEGIKKWHERKKLESGDFNLD